MADGVQDRDSHGERRPALVYPLGQPPEPGEAVEVATGVFWMRMPLGGPLSFINVWALKDGDGWALVDTGMQTSPTSKAWRKVIAGPLGGKPISRVFVTHLHPTTSASPAGSPASSIAACG